MTKEVYTKEVMEDMVARYTDVVKEDYDVRSAVLVELADELKQSVASVRAKLVREGVYVAKEATKGTATGMSKDEYVKAFEAVAGVELKSFTKATKKDLAAFWEYLVKASDRAEAEKAA